MTVEAFLRSIGGCLRDSGIPFMLTGSFAAAYHGASRATMDIDLVIDPTLQQLDRFLVCVAAVGAYVSADAAHEALEQRTMFNVVDSESGWKADLIIRKERLYSREEFDRRIPIDYFGARLDIAALEDAIISKLEWAQLGNSARQLEDVRALLRVRSEDLDQAYVRRWVEALGLQDQWTAVTAES